MQVTLHLVKARFFVIVAYLFVKTSVFKLEFVLHFLLLHMSIKSSFLLWNNFAKCVEVKFEQRFVVSSVHNVL